MKKLVLVLLMAAFVLAGAVLARDAVVVPPQEGPSFYGYAPNKCVVILKEGAPPVEGNAALAGVAERFQVSRFARQFPAAKESHPVDGKLTRYYKAHFPEGNLDDVMEAYSKLPFVDRVEPIGIYRLTATPNDFHYDDSTGGFPYTQWHYWDTYGINADSAWDLETGNTSVIVAVADAGVKYDHFELGGTDPPGPNDNVTNGNIWVNDGEIPGNGIDDDNNGYVDDVIGWDFVASASYCNDADCTIPDNDPRDGNGHGTHVAGTIGAITNNYAAWGVAGIAGGWNDGTTNFDATGVRVMCLRIGWNSIFGGLVGMDYAAEAFYYIATMVDKGYNITAVNCSWGSSSLIADATDAVLARGVMVVVAAGNSNSSTPDYLGSRGDCLDVGGTERSGNPYSGSNYGSWVDIAAPAVDVLSTYTDPGDPTGDYIAVMTGTSMACPHVVGVTALLESYDPTLTAAQKTAIITDVNNTKPYKQTKYVGVGIVDARKCLDAVGPECDLVADFSGTPTSGCVALTVDFTDLSTGTGIDGWDWDFGDGIGTSTDQHPSYTYNSVGTYTVTLTVSSSSQGCDDTEIKTGYITVNGGPTADFVGDPLTGTEPLTVTFTDLSADATSWDWDFGDGVGSSAEQNPVYTYDNAGTYTVTLTVTNACGSDIEEKIDYITVDPCVAPVADFEGVPTAGPAPLTVDFSDLSTGNPTTWDWDFGDGVGTSNEKDPSYTYNDPGDYTVTLTAGNVCGSDVEIKIDYIHVDTAGAVKVFAESEATEKGTIVSGSYLDTWDSDNVYEVLREAESGGKPSNRYSMIDHRWTFTVPAGANTSFFVEGYRPDNAEDDDFTLEYSLDNNNFTPLVTISSATEQTYSTGMGNVSGTVYIRIVDTDHTPGNRTFDDVYVDYMYIESGGTPPPPDTMWVFSIDVTREGGRANKYQGVATVVIYNQDNDPVVGALVTGTFSGPSSDTQSGTTDATGAAVIKSDAVKGPVGIWCFTVDNVELGTNVYDPSRNNETTDCEAAAKAVYGGQPTEFELSQNQPNPFNPKTTVSFGLPNDAHVRLDIFNILGQNVATLVDGHLTAGWYSYDWDGSDVASGIYLYRLTTDTFSQTKQMVLMK